ncbi:MAG: 16S rRNA processing protein RimM [Spirochaetes bacterium]|nr:16S rRNA processing protein RimM [Spirochaetota bacterium]MCK5268122.1 16S rRNA processing protein RimM [Spirochaetota bacterium]
MDEVWVHIGGIAKPHGIKGEVKARLYTDNAAFYENKECFFVFDGTRYKSLETEYSKIFKDGLIVKIKGCDTRSEAESYANEKLYVKKTELEKLKEDEYYFNDLIGLEVRMKGGKKIGKVEYVFNSGATDIFEIQLDSENKTLNIPYIEQVVSVIDLEKGYLEVDTEFLDV